MRRDRLHGFHGSDFIVDVIGLAAGGKKPCRNVRKARGDAPGDLQSRIVRVACAEEDFVDRVILVEEAGQIFGQTWLGAVKRLEQSEGWRKVPSGAGGAPFSEIAGYGGHHDASDDR